MVTSCIKLCEKYKSKVWIFWKWSKNVKCFSFLSFFMKRCLGKTSKSKKPKKGNLFQQLYSQERGTLKLNLNIMKNVMIYYLHSLLISSSQISKTCNKFTSLQYLGNIPNIAILVSQIGWLPFPKTPYFIRIFMLSQTVKKMDFFFSFRFLKMIISSVICLLLGLHIIEKLCFMWKNSALPWHSEDFFPN